MFRINDLFYTLQGEGLHAGRAALFIRMPFCNLACSWCDTKFDTFKTYSEEKFRSLVKDVPSKFAVITGGEPSMNKDVPLILSILKEYGFEVAMESNGQFLSPAVDHLTISPKRFSNRFNVVDDVKYPFWFDFKNTPSEIKLVVDSPLVLKVAFELYNDWRSGKFSFKDNARPLFYLSPEWSQKDIMLPQLVNFIKENPWWKTSLQTHKLMNIP